MLAADIWETLDRIQKDKMNAQINSEWDNIQKHLKERLIEVANQGNRSMTMVIAHEINRNRMVELFKSMENFVCDASPTQQGTYAIKIFF